MIITLMRTVILYFVVLFTIRIMGKSELSKMSPFQMVVIFMIAELASIPIESPSVSMAHGIVAIFSLLFLQMLISLLSIKSEKFKNFLNGKPSVLIENGKINVREMKNLRISNNDLLEQLRIGGTASLSDVEYAIMEENGDLSIILKTEKKPLTAEDMSIKKEKEHLPLILISDGVLYGQNLKSMGLNEKYLKKQMAANGFTEYKDIFFAFSDEKQKLHFYRADKLGEKASEVTK